MKLKLQRQGNGWTGSLALFFPSSDQRDQSLKLDDLRVSERELNFTDPKAAQNLLIKFHGVKAGPRELRGHAEATSTNPASSVRLIGSWRLRKK